ncbi:methionyl-tRNA formyltransferase [Opacimonas viscosa]|uniref:Methionyl-tRNA formyltransferase n=1 Tax=Opacimonas viscosa TaxID=2961944 RepID=A0AA41X2M7_9ALTE|nr:methionyl-tRNA formyltransferase [Opacimonas viscosa]MCP3428747.1 methionyl-tRNA formyltransferase [Opacimonas viscosa]
MSKPLNIVFAGTPDFAAQHLKALLASQHNVIAVYTQPDRPAGRGKKLTPSAVKVTALEHTLPVYQPENFKSKTSQDELKALNADIMVVVAYGLLLPQVVLDTPALGCINVHGSLLPRWRGAAPIQRALWAGDTETGVTIMQMDIGLDTGAMLHKTQCPIGPEDTSATLYEKLAQQGPDALVHVLDNFTQCQPVPQNEDQANYAKKLSKAEAQIDWHMSAVQLALNVRAFNPWPMAFFTLAENNIKVWEAKPVAASNTSPGLIISADNSGLVIGTGEGALCITRCQIPGKKPMAFADIYNSRADWFVPGTVL